MLAAKQQKGAPWSPQNISYLPLAIYNNLIEGISSIIIIKLEEKQSSCHKAPKRNFQPYRTPDAPTTEDYGLGRFRRQPRPILTKKKFGGILSEKYGFSLHLQIGPEWTHYKQDEVV